MQTSDWLIIGGGVPALVSAFYLQQRGETVTIIDNNYPSASRAGAGILSPLPPWHYPPPLRRFAAAGAAAYPQLLSAIGDSCGWYQSGMLVLPPFGAEALAQWRREGAAVQMLNAATLSAHLPAAEAAYLPRIDLLQPRRLIKALRRQMRRRHIATVNLLAVENKRLQYAQLADGSRWAGRRVLLAAGAWCGRLCPPPPPSIRPVRGQMLVYRGEDITLPAVLLQAQHNFYIVQRQDGYLLAGSTCEQAGFDGAPSADGIRLLRQRAAALLPPLSARCPRSAWAGLRPAAAHPVIARHPEVKNLYLNSGHFRYGVTMAPAAAAHLLRVADNEITAADNPYGWC